MSIFNIIRNDKKCDEELMKEVKDIRDELKGVLSILSNSGVKPIVGSELKSGVTKTTNSPQTANIPRLTDGLAAQIRGGATLKKTSNRSPKETTLMDEIQKARGGGLKKTGNLDDLKKGKTLPKRSTEEKTKFQEFTEEMKNKAQEKKKKREGDEKKEGDEASGDEIRSAAKTNLSF